MNESWKATLGILVFFGCITAITWFDPPVGETWQYKVRWVSLALIVLPTVILVWAIHRKNKVPDFLEQHSKRYFERNGFCFAVVPEVKDGFCLLTAYFQNRYERPCRASIVLTPSSFLFKENEQTKTLALGVACEAAGFGRISTQWPIPQESQGNPATLDVAASVEYPQGRGKLLRYRDGLRVGATRGDFWREGLIIGGALAGAIVISKPARIKIILPTNVMSELSSPPQTKTEIIWKLGDPLPNNLAERFFS